jgi:hypothetical protein
MSSRSIGIITISGLGLFLRAQSNAAIIADWTFESTQPTTAGPYSPEVGAGTATANHAGTSTYSSPAGNGSAHAYSSNNWAEFDSYEFEVSTVGDTGIGFQFDQTSSGTGPANFTLFYSTDGSDFSEVASYTVSNDSWSSITYKPISTHFFDLSSITALNNQSTVYLELLDGSTTDTLGTTVGSSGTDRVDNVIVTSPAVATPVPEPTALGLLMVSGLSIRRRRQ